MKILITICARGGSKGIPGKNIKLLYGKPLIHYTLNQANNLAKVIAADIQISTDSTEILDCAAQLGFVTEYIRPAEFGTDGAGKISAIRDVWHWTEKHNEKKYDFVLDMDVTSPLRTIDDLLKALTMIKKSPETLSLFSVNPAARNPYFNMVEVNDDGYAVLCKSASLIKSRQQAPKVYDMNASFYFFSREFLTGDYQSSTTERSLAFVMDHLCFDLDEKHDFQIMEIMLKEGLIDFEI